MSREHWLNERIAELEAQLAELQVKHDYAMKRNATLELTTKQTAELLETIQGLIEHRPI